MSVLRGDEKRMKAPFRFFCRRGLVVFLVASLTVAPTIAADKIRIATGGLAASSAAVWAALETKTFQKHGLEPEYIIIDNGTVAGQALLAGELHYLVSTGALAITANLKGGDLTIIGGIINFIPFQLIGRRDQNRGGAERKKSRDQPFRLGVGLRCEGSAEKTSSRSGQRHGDHSGRRPERPVRCLDAKRRAGGGL